MGSEISIPQLRHQSPLPLPLPLRSRSLLTLHWPFPFSTARGLVTLRVINLRCLPFTILFFIPILRFCGLGSSISSGSSLTIKAFSLQTLRVHLFSFLSSAVSLQFISLPSRAYTR
ncbi:hypothetical protein AMTR_s00074p00133470 [Amborella trichopoda]|uniref:Uncharacterized protein n=1 Tax=Amborella trichopoda TaxID=13333 RepID=W1NMX1_AMBTC|nr:hypothetical protein AMTR_s00074p00133470 [Amborella trichopoda]